MAEQWLVTEIKNDSNNSTNQYFALMCCILHIWFENLLSSFHFLVVLQEHNNLNLTHV